MPARGFVRLQGEVVPGLAPALARGALRRVPATRAADSAPLTLTLTLTLRRSDQTGFERFLAAVENRRSSEFRHFLTQRQLAAKFGPSLGSYDAVLGWLRSEGFRLVQGSANRLTITVRGALRKTEMAFHVELNEYTEGSTRVFANVTNPTLPAAIARSVAAVSGLSDLSIPRAGPAALVKGHEPASSMPVPRSAKQVIEYINTIKEPCATAWGNAQSGKANSDLAEFSWALAADFACITCQLNNLTALSSGGTITPCGDLPSSSSSPLARRAVRLRMSGSAGADPEKVGLLEYDTFNPQDVADWISLTGGPASELGRLSEVPVNGGVAAPGSGEGEVLLDVDSVLFMTTPSDANVVVYDAPPSTSFVQLFNAMLGSGDTVISNSWVECEDQVSDAEAQSINSVLAEAAASGVSVLNASGDDGSTCNGVSSDTAPVPADSPNATAVGGSTIKLGPAGTYAGETWWDGSSADPSTGQGGFGTSKYFSRPPYQNGLTTAGGRSIPDVVAVADPEDGMNLCEADDAGCPDGLLSGGTSLAAPEWAANVANLDSALGRPIGDLNAALYPLANTSAFHSASDMGSDFAHVGLGDANYSQLLLALSHSSPGPVSATHSAAVAVGAVSPEDPSFLSVPADGTSTGTIRVDLTDADGFPVSGKTVTLSSSSGTAKISPASGPSDDTSGSVTFTVTDTTPETVTFTAKDTTDNVTLTTQPTLTFVPPVATGASISANPTSVASDGTSQTTISVYLQNALGQPAVGKTVSLSQNGGNASITPVSGQAVTDSTGTATFTATDSTEQAVAFTATDVTDNNLPVPGSATVNFEPNGGSQCSDAAPTAAAGYSIAPFVTGLQFNARQEAFDSFSLNACSGPFAPAFDSSGVAYVPDFISGQIFTFGPSGGTADAMTALPETSFAPAQLATLAFDKSGNLYAGLYTTGTGGNFSAPELVQVDPTTGATERVVANIASGLLPCPSIAVDPISGDVFSDDGCTGLISDNDLVRISNPQSASPTVTDYADLGQQSGGMAFAPDGTLYVAVRGNDRVVQVTGTNAAQPATVTTVATLPNSPSSVAIASVNASGQATALYVGDFSGNITRIDLTQDPATTSPVATTNGGLVVDAAVGPDGCLYANGVPTLLKVSGPGCSEASAGPEIALQQTSGSSTPATGSAIDLTAALQNVTSPSGTPVHFAITGPNVGVKLVNASVAGQATMSYAGVLQGVDTVTASAVVNGKTITSAPVDVHWTAGKDTTFLDLNASQQGGPVGQSATMTASLVDVAHTPPTTLSGQSVTLSLAGRSCTAQTNSSGVASCNLTPSSAGLLPVTASYAGNTQYTASTGSNIFVSGALGLETVPPKNTSAPKISGTAKAGQKLSCSTGSWSNYPDGYAYQWSRDGTPIAGATTSTYKIQPVDEGITLTCTVTASNSDGPGKPATSKGLTVPVPKIHGCPAATGKLNGTTLGLLHLGMTRKQALHAYTHSSTRGKRYQTFFCLTPRGVRAGYASPDVLKTLPRNEANKLRGRVIWASTSSDYYSVHTIRPGASLATAREHLKLTKPFQVGKNTWYLAPNGSSTAVFKVRKGIIEEIGIGDKQLTQGRKAQRTFLTSFS